MGDEFDDYLAGFTPQRASVAICLRGDVADELRQLGEELVKARREDEARGTIAGNAAPALESRIAALDVERNLALREFAFEAIGQYEWQQMVTKHPPTDEQREQGAQWGEDFSAVAIQLCCVKPRMTAEQVRRLRSTINQTQWLKLFGALLQCNTADDAGPKSPLGSQPMNGSEPKSTSPVEPVSLTASS